MLRRSVTRWVLGLLARVVALLAVGWLVVVALALAVDQVARVGGLALDLMLLAVVVLFVRRAGRRRRARRLARL